MTDLAAAVQKALFDALSAGVTVASVYQHVPENTPPPVVIIGEDSIDNQDAPKGTRLERHEVNVITVIRGPGKLPLYAAQEQVRAALEGAAISAPGAVLSRPVRLSTSDQLLDDGATYYGSSRFLIIAQPAG